MKVMWGDLQGGARRIIESLGAFIPRPAFCSGLPVF